MTEVANSADPDLAASDFPGNISRIEAAVAAGSCTSFGAVDMNLAA